MGTRGLLVDPVVSDFSGSLPFIELSNGFLFVNNSNRVLFIFHPEVVPRSTHGHSKNIRSLFPLSQQIVGLIKIDLKEAALHYVGRVFVLINCGKDLVDATQYDSRRIIISLMSIEANLDGVGLARACLTVSDQTSVDPLKPF